MPFSNTDSIRAADSMVTLAEHELELVEMARERLAAPGLTTEQRAEVNQVLTSSNDCWNIHRQWRQLGRHAVGIHPDLYAELALSETSKIPGEVLWALPYRNPMVVYPHRPIVDLGSYGTRRILGFYLSGLRSMDPVTPDNYDPATAAADTHDRDTQALRLTIYTEVVSANDPDTRIDYETFYYSVPRTGADTFEALCEQISDRLIRYGGSRPGLGDGSTFNRPEELRHLLSPVLATVFYLCSTTLDAQPVSKAIARRRTPPGRKPVRLVNVGWFLGPELASARRAAARAEFGDRTDTTSTGRQQRPHQRRCHFALRWTGKGRTVPRTVFIAPFWVHPELLDVDSSTTLNPANPKAKS